MTARPSKYPPFTVNYAIDQIDDPDRLRELARQLWSAMVGQHALAAHLLGVDVGDCAPCADAKTQADPAFACDQYWRWQAEYQAAVNAV